LAAENESLGGYMTLFAWSYV